MLKLNIYFYRRTSLFLLIVFGLIHFAIPGQVQGQVQLLPSALGELRAAGPELTLHQVEWSALEDADVYAEYGLRTLANRIYSDGKRKVTVEVFEMQHDSGAYGLYTFHRGALPANRQEFYHGRYLVSIARDKDDWPINSSDISLPSLIEGLKSSLASVPGPFPALPSHLPAQNKIAESETYLVGPAALSQIKKFSDFKDAVNFTGGTEVVIADYQNGNALMNLIIVEYHTPQLASEGRVRAENYLNSLPQQEKERRILKRIGNYIVQAVNVQDMPGAQKIVSQIKYNPKVYWEGRKLSDIPLQFRPPDPVALAEAKRTVFFIVRSFFWVVILLAGTLLMGVITGGAYFYWKRYRRRKLGLDDFFSDTGETVRLNLDDFLLQPEDTPVKQIGSGQQ
jgi:Family of unknown function (DUF6599)